MKCFGHKGECGIHVLKSLKEELAWAVDKWFISNVKTFTPLKALRN